MEQLNLFDSIVEKKGATKICNKCRTSYYTWKNNYPDFGNILTRIELELSNSEPVVDREAVNDSKFIHKSDT